MKEVSSPRRSVWTRLRGPVLLVAAIVMLSGYLFPIAYMALTSLKPADKIQSMTPGFLFKPGLFGYVEAFTNRRLPVGEAITEEERSKPQWYHRMAVERHNPILGPSGLHRKFLNSLLIAGLATLLSVMFGAAAAYGFSRFRIPAGREVLYFILSTRMLPPVALIIPVYLMYSKLHLVDTYTGLILLYVAFNLSFSTWLMKGFIDEIPKEYEEAAWVDGYTRLRAFFKIVLPQAMTGIAATAVFCFIFSWNEYVFALILSPGGTVQTVPTFLPNQVASGRVEWEAVAGGSILFLLPVMLLTLLLRKHLLRGISFGAIRK